MKNVPEKKVQEKRSQLFSNKLSHNMHQGYIIFQTISILLKRKYLQLLSNNACLSHCF